MDNSKYEAVRAKIVEACPDLMELSFGCSVEWSRTGKLTLDIRYVGQNSAGNPMVYIPFSQMTKAVKMKELKILGHTPRLSHVLRAIRKADNERREFYLFGKLERDMSKIEGEVCSRFNLEKDDLSLERPETIDFLFKILCE